MERIAQKREAARTAIVEIGKSRINAFDPVDTSVKRAEHITDHGKPVDKMTRTIGFDHNEIEPVGHIVGGENIACNRQAAKGKLRTINWSRIMFVRPFDKVVVAVIACKNAFRVRQGQNDPTLAQAIHLVIPVKPMVARDQIARARQNTEMLELAGAVIPDFDVIGVCVKANTDTACHWYILLVRDQLTSVNHHTLTATAGRRDPTVLRLVDKAVSDVKGKTVRRHHDSTGNATTLKLDVIENELAQLFIPGKIEHVLKAREGEDLRPLGIKEWETQLYRLRTLIDGRHIDFAPHTIALNQ